MSGDANAQEKWSKSRDASGITGLRRIISTCGFDGKDWMTQAFVDAPGPRSGLLTMLDVKPLPQDLLRNVPASATSVVAGSLDFAKFIETIRTAAGQDDPQAAP